MKSTEEVRLLRKADGSKFEIINKMVFANICILVVMIIMIGVLFVTFKG